MTIGGKQLPVDFTILQEPQTQNPNVADGRTTELLSKSTTGIYKGGSSR
jgi:hypothetical protein